MTSGYISLNNNRYFYVKAKPDYLYICREWFWVGFYKDNIMNFKPSPFLKKLLMHSQELSKERELKAYLQDYKKIVNIIENLGYLV